MSDSNTCCICRRSYSFSGPKTKSMIPCEHEACRECFEKILQHNPGNATCPICRDPFEEGEIKRFWVSCEQINPAPPVLGTKQIFVKDLGGSTMTLWVHPTDKIKKVKHHIKVMKGIPIRMQRLIFGGKQLQDHLTIYDYNIRSGNTMHLVLRLHGGL